MERAFLFKLVFGTPVRVEFFGLELFEFSKLIKNFIDFFRKRQKWVENFWYHNLKRLLKQLVGTRMKQPKKVPHGEFLKCHIATAQSTICDAL